MSIRLYWSPIIGTGTKADKYRPTAFDKPKLGANAVIPSIPRYNALGDEQVDWGKPKFVRTLCLVSAEDWTAFDADVNEILLLPDLVLNTRAELLDAIKGRTVVDIPVAYRTRWLDVLATFGVSTADITGATPLARVLRRVLVSIDPHGSDENGFF